MYGIYSSATMFLLPAYQYVWLGKKQTLKHPTACFFMPYSCECCCSRMPGYTYLASSPCGHTNVPFLLHSSDLVWALSWTEGAVVMVPFGKEQGPREPVVWLVRWDEHIPRLSVSRAISCQASRRLCHPGTAALSVAYIRPLHWPTFSYSTPPGYQRSTPPTYSFLHYPSST